MERGWQGSGYPHLLQVSRASPQSLAVDAAFLQQLSKPLGRHGHNKSLGIKAAAEEVAGEGQ